MLSVGVMALEPTALFSVWVGGLTGWNRQEIITQLHLRVSEGCYQPLERLFDVTCGSGGGEPVLHTS